MLKLRWRWVLFCLFPLFLLADHVHWLGRYDIAHQKALEAHKPLLLLVVKPNDTPSHDILKNVFMNRSYISLINEKFVPVIVTFGSKQNYPVEMYYTTTFPTLFFVDAAKEIFIHQPLYGKEIRSETVLNALTIK